MAFIDATYKCCIYDLPLYLIAVKTNCDYQVVALFITEDECTTSIEEGLKHLKEHNLGWNPTYFMTDFDESQINALEHTFPGNIFNWP
jgi:hypothetical protein